MPVYPAVRGIGPTTMGRLIERVVELLDDGVAGPDSLVDPAMKNPLGIAAGLIAMGAYLYFLRDALFPRK